MIIDLHSHIFPGMDDGAASMEDALEMARMAVDAGTEIIAATVHGDFSRGLLRRLGWKRYMERYRSRLAEFRLELKRKQIPLEVMEGMEILVNKDLFRFIDETEEEGLPSLNGGGSILVEFEFDISGISLMDSLECLMQKKRKIVLAHPERYDCVKRDFAILYALYDKGIILQVNKGSLAGDFGQRAYRRADLMLREGIAGIVASDAHDPVLRTPELDETADLLNLYYGHDAAEILLKRNPRRVLEVTDPGGVWR